MTDVTTTESINAPALTSDSPADIMAAILEMAANPSIDLDRLNRLMQMQEQMEQRQAEKEFDDALARVQSGVGPILKNQENKHTKSTYADLRSVNDTAMPLLSAEGFSVTFREGEAAEGRVSVIGILSRGGVKREFPKTLPVDATGVKGNENKIAIHAHQSAVTYAKRYLMFDMLNIATTDDDGNATGRVEPEYVNLQQLDQLRVALDEVGRTEEAFCTYANITSLAHLPAARFDEAMRRIREATNNG